jgi:hypothetical protein
MEGGFPKMRTITFISQAREMPLLAIKHTFSRQKSPLTACLRIAKLQKLTFGKSLEKIE